MSSKKREKPMGLEIFDFSGKKALVTGPSQGIGLTLACGLAAAGIRIIVNGRNREKLWQAAESIGKDTLQLAV